MSDNDQSPGGGDEKPLKEAVAEVRQAEHDLEEIRRAEHRAEERLEEAVEKLEETEKEREVTIIVNGRPKHWVEPEISYEQLVKIANLPLPPGPNPGFTITYHEGPPHHPEGTLTEGHSVKVVNGMIFNVTPTNKS
jgi:multiubiquitin